MFTGIIQSISSIVFVTDYKEDLKIQIKRPQGVDFSDLKLGDSVSVDGVCLTLESESSQNLGFHLGHETLKVTNWTKQILLNKKVNLETALKVGGVIGGHFITGHVDGVALITSYINKGKSLLLEIKIPNKFKHYFWEKSFISLNGVSLTVNNVKNNYLTMCLIPETLKRSNLLFQKVENVLTFEVDSLARSMVSALKNLKE